MKSLRGDGGIGCMAGCAVGALLMLLIPLMLAGFARDKDLTKPTGGSVIGEGGCLSPLTPPIKDQAALGDAIDAYIKSFAPRSPMIGTGGNFVAAGVKHGINPIWVITIAQKESGFGLAGFAAEKANNAFGRTATPSQPHVVSPKGRLWYKYESFAASADGQSEYLKRRYIDEGLTTMREIVYTYAPPSENNTEQYIKDIERSMGKLAALAGSALDCNGSGSSGSVDVGNVPAGNDVGICKNSRQIREIPVKNNRLAHTTLVRKLELLWERNKTWRVTEACPPSSRHADRNHYNGRAVDIALNPPGSATEEKIRKLLEDVRAVGFDDVLDEYHRDTTYKTGGHIHLEWHGN
jgi:hypothetical protein